MTTALRFFYRRVYVTGLETIAKEGPAIIIANHTSSLMDAALLGVLIERPVHFFTRADVFSGKLFSKILNALNMIPISNHEAGRNTLSSNKDSYSKAEQILANGGIVVFFPEGISHIERRIMPLRKGVFRLAFQWAVRDNFQNNIPVIPTGINYSHPFACQADVMIHFGTPLLLNDYKEEYLLNEAATLLHITKDSYAAIQKNALFVKDAAKYDLVENCLRIKRNDYSFFTRQWMQGTRKRLEEEKFICSNIDELLSFEQSDLQKNNKDYFEMLQLYNIRDKALSPLFKFSCCKKLMLFVGSPFFILGYLLNCLPIKVAKKITDTRVYRLDFYSWIFVSCAAFFYLVWLLALFLSFIGPGWPYAICIVLITISGGIFAQHYLQCYNDYIQVKRLDKLQHKNPAIIKQLKEKRRRIIEMI
ncbi:MAG: 1-acyl-sn-glycerol-3-phosphate acyltransferase [Chitinophagaceae bacterium]